MRSENTAGAEATDDTKPGIDNLAQLLMADAPADNTADNDATTDSEASGSEKAKLTKFNDLAGRLEVDLDTLYKLEVSQAEDGTPVTVENLKDHYAKKGEFSLQEIEYEERRRQQENDILQAKEELQQIMSALPESAIKPELLNQLRARNAKRMDVEKRKTLDAIPEWKNDDVRTSDIAGISEHLQRYGYPVDHLARVTDHRQMKYFRDNWKREKSIQAALAKVKPGKPSPTTAGKPGNKAPQKNPLAGVRRGAARNKLEAVFSNLK